jgi:hypothetical protein
MKGILEFDLNDFDDSLNHKRAVKSDDMALCLWDISSKLRKEVDDYRDMCYNQNKKISNGEIVEKTMEIINSYFENHNINIEELNP